MFYPPANPKATEEDLRKLAASLRSLISIVKQRPETVTANITLGADSPTCLVNATSGAVTVTLPPAQTASGSIISVKKLDSSVNTVTVQANASETIDGANTYSLLTQWAVVTIICDGSAWFIV